MVIVLTYSLSSALFFYHTDVLSSLLSTLGLRYFTYGIVFGCDRRSHSSHRWWSWGIIFDRDWVWPTAWWRQAAASFYGAPRAAQESGGTAGPSQNLPGPQHLHAGPGAAGPHLQTAHAQWDVPDARHGNGWRPPVRPGVGEQVAEGPVQNQEVL